MAGYERDVSVRGKEVVAEDMRQYAVEVAEIVSLLHLYL